MIKTLILVNGLLLMLSISCASLYLQFTMRKLLFKIKMRLSQNAMSVRDVYKKMEAMETVLSSMERVLADQQILRAGQELNDIEKQYKKAKSVLKRGSKEEMHSLQGIDMTSEEIELLTGLMQSVDFNGKTGVTKGREF